MPLYAYECEECSLRQEHILKISEEPPECEGCGAASGKLKKQINIPSVRFERSVGWDGWDRTGPGMIGREVPVSKHIDDGMGAGGDQRNPGSTKAV